MVNADMQSLSRLLRRHPDDRHRVVLRVRRPYLPAVRRNVEPFRAAPARDVSQLPGLVRSAWWRRRNRSGRRSRGSSGIRQLDALDDADRSRVNVGGEDTITGFVSNYHVRAVLTGAQN